MSLVPFLLNELIEDYRRPMVSDIFDQDFGFHHDPLERQMTQLLTGPLRSGYIRPWRTAEPHKTGVSTVKNDKTEFSVNLDVQHFKPEELKVTVHDGFLVIDGKHEEKSDEHGFISRSFTRRYKLPEDVDAEALSSKLHSDGVLSLKAPKKPAIEAKGREIPITATNEPLKVTAGKKSENQEKMES